MESKPVHLLHGNNKRPPLHVHLSDTTPLHVHVDKPSKPPNILRSLSQDRNANIYKVINRQKLQNQQIQKQRSILQNSKNNVPNEEARESRIDQVIQKEKSLKAYELKLKDIERKNNQLLDNIEVLCANIENKSGLREPSKIRDWLMFLKNTSRKIEQFDCLLRKLKEEDLETETEDKLEELSRESEVLSNDMTKLHHLIICLGEDLKQLSKSDKSRGELDAGFFNSELECLKKALKEKEMANYKLKEELQKAKDELILNNGTVDSLMNSKAHLQRQLTFKQADLQRAMSRLNSVEKCDVQKCSHKCPLSNDRAQLKHAARLYKTKYQEVQRNADSMKNQLDQSTHQISLLNREKISLETELHHLKSFKSLNGEVGDGLGRNEVNNLNQTINDLKMKLQENEIENKMMKRGLQEYEDLVKDYKSQNNKLKEDIGNYMAKIENLQHELVMNKNHNGDELAKISRKFEMLNQGSNNQDLFEKIDPLEKKIKILEEEKMDLIRMNDKKEAALSQKKLTLEERIKELNKNQVEMDELKNELRKMKECEQDKIYSVERSGQLKRLEMEGQIETLKQDINKVNREKMETERRSQQQLLDMRDRLEQCNSTNRTLQNYIHFLKTSYSATFNEPISTLSSNDSHFFTKLSTMSQLT